jgi:hypothetical protein
LDNNEDADPVFKTYAVPFTKTSYYMYISYFLKGLDLEKLIKGADLCLNQAFYTVDEFTYFANNASDAEWENW